MYILLSDDIFENLHIISKSRNNQELKILGIWVIHIILHWKFLWQNSHLYVCGALGWPGQLWSKSFDDLKWNFLNSWSILKLKINEVYGKNVLITFYLNYIFKNKYLYLNFFKKREQFPLFTFPGHTSHV